MSLWRVVSLGIVSSSLACFVGCSSSSSQPKGTPTAIPAGGKTVQPGSSDAPRMPGEQEYTEKYGVERSHIPPDPATGELPEATGAGEPQGFPKGAPKGK